MPAPSSGEAWARGISPDKANREKDDFYETPPEATRALLSVESFEGAIWEPACGRGAISKVLEGAGHEVISTDLMDRGYGENRVDFLMEWRPLAPNIVTNPAIQNGRGVCENRAAVVNRQGGHAVTPGVP